MSEDLILCCPASSFVRIKEGVQSVRHQDQNVKETTMTIRVGVNGFGRVGRTSSVRWTHNSRQAPPISRSWR